MKQLFRSMLSFAAAVLLCTACSDNDSTNAPIDEPLPEGCGRLILNVTTAETATTRGATGEWLDGTTDERAIKSYHILVCNGTTIVDDIAGNALEETAPAAPEKNYYLSEFTAQSKGIPGGTYTYTFYALVNFTDAMIGQAGLTLVGGKITDTTLPSDFETKAIRTANTATVPMTGIPMTGILGPLSVTITSGNTTEIAAPLVLWRMMAKMEFQFSNTSTQKVRILGIEIDPINKASDGKGIFLISKDDLGSTANDAPSTGTDRVPDKTDVGTYEHTFTAPATSLLELDKKTDAGEAPTGNVSFYVNETDASATSTQNQYSVRFKIQRYNSVTETWYDDEFRLGFTSPHTSGGFSVIRRNDWIKIPVFLTDWEFRVEMLPYAPIGGYAAYVDSADALETTFNTQGYICMRPLFRNSMTDAPDVWHTITDGGITLVLPHAQADYTDGQYIDTGTNTGIILTGDLDILDSKFVQLGSTENIVANLSKDNKGTITVSLRVKLGGNLYEFSHKVTRK